MIHLLRCRPLLTVKMDPRGLPNLGAIGYINEWLQNASPGSCLGRLLLMLHKCATFCSEHLSRLRMAPFHYWLTLALTMVTGFLGIVPGALSLAGKEEASAIVAILAGCCAVLLAFIQSFPREDWIRASNQ